MSMEAATLSHQATERGGFWRSGFPLILEGAGLELLGDARGGLHGAVGGVRHALPTGAEATTGNPVNRREKHQPLPSAL